MKFNFENKKIEKEEDVILSAKEIEEHHKERRKNCLAGIDEMVKVANEIVNEHKANIKEFFCTREAEIAVRDRISNNIKLEAGDFSLINEKIISLLDEKNEDVAFTMFFALFTNIRKSKMFYELDENNTNIEGFVLKYRIYFKADYPIYSFIYLLGKYCIDRSKGGLKNIVDTIENELLTRKDLENHAGIINFFSETVCEYYETYLEEIESSESDKEIKKAINWINKAIRMDSASSSVSYHKYYLNLGRLHVLSCDFNEGFKFINTAIKYAGEALAGNDALREKTISKYELYIVKASTIQAYHESNNRISELASSKTSNYKTLTLIAALLGLITGEIQVMSNEVNPVKLGYLMTFYFGLIVFLATLVLMFINISNKEKVKLRTKIFLLVLFGVSLTLIIGSFFLIKGM